jgi:mannose-6-phosphate isomerase class I
VRKELRSETDLLFGEVRLSHFEESFDLFAVEKAIKVHIHPNKQLVDASFTSSSEPTIRLVREKRNISRD